MVVLVVVGATGESGEEVVLSSVVVVVVELGIELSSLAQPARVRRLAAANREGISVFIELLE